MYKVSNENEIFMNFIIEKINIKSINITNFNHCIDLLAQTVNYTDWIEIVYSKTYLQHLQHYKFNWADNDVGHRNNKHPVQDSIICLTT